MNLFGFYSLKSYPYQIKLDNGFEIQIFKNTVIISKHLNNSAPGKIRAPWYIKCIYVYQFSITIINK